MADEHKHFWLKLLDYGETEQERQNNWNIYCVVRLAPTIDRLLVGETLDEFQRRALGIGWDTRREFARGLENRLGPCPEIPDNPSVNPFMNFREVVFSDEVSFSGRVLIGADFREADFRKKTDFQGARLLGLTHFDRAKFPYDTEFKDVTFSGAALFRDVEFRAKYDRSGSPYAVVDFKRSKFQTTVDFSGATFGVSSTFEGVEFQGTAKFDAAKFQSNTIFNNARFQGPTSFRKTAFNKPPRFFETELHEDVDFSSADWSKAEESYKRSWLRLGRLDNVEKDAGNAVRAWDRLALIMSQREKSPERHEFFRLKMRALRQRDGCNFPSLVNWLFDVTSDYGWGIRRAFSWWFGHVAFGAVILGATTEADHASTAKGYFLIVRDSILVSFANAHAFLGLASDGGYLHGASENLTKAYHVDWLYSAVGATQTVLGPILLFLVLLTLRNRFRLG